MHLFFPVTFSLSFAGPLLWNLRLAIPAIKPHNVSPKQAPSFVHFIAKLGKNRLYELYLQSLAWHTRANKDTDRDEVRRGRMEAES
jgi:hypothetical protein